MQKCHFLLLHHIYSYYDVAIMNHYRINVLVKIQLPLSRCTAEIFLIFLLKHQQKCAACHNKKMLKM